MKKIISIILAVGIAGFCAVPVSAQAPKKSEVKNGKIEYPASGVMKYNEGTFEIWFKPLFDMSEKKPGTLPEIHCFLLFIGDSLGDEGLKVRCESFDKGGLLKISSMYLKSYMALVQEKLKWKPDEWHYFAMSWKYMDDQKNMHFVCYIDGKEYLKMDNPVKAELPSTDNYVIRLGNPKYNARVLFDAIRFSSGVRTPEEIAASFNGGPKVDGSTTLVDSFDKLQIIDKARAGTTTEERIPGTVIGYYEKLPGRYGNAIKLAPGN
ncbi:MAG TPA: hypothetical protein DET40_07020 [Lentisphaeria bacterium]|nr:MAG: hypothetical protein A2X45_07280 [Lentisphaerae bacterium GWF2_50_93]HCE43282.1 hypothetical protein [Lentisphaeria bacterium]